MHVELLTPADRHQWLAARKQDVTASVAAALLNAHPFTTPYQIWAEKTGKTSPDDDETEAMARGRYLEPVGVAMLRDRHTDWDIQYDADNAYYRAPALRIGEAAERAKRAEMEGGDGEPNGQGRLVPRRSE